MDTRIYRIYSYTDHQLLLCVEISIKIVYLQWCSLCLLCYLHASFADVTHVLASLVSVWLIAQQPALLLLILEALFCVVPLLLPMDPSAGSRADRLVRLMRLVLCCLLHQPGFNRQPQKWFAWQSKNSGNLCEAKA